MSKIISKKYRSLYLSFKYLYLFICIIILFYQNLYAKKISIRIGTGSTAGIYYPTGRAIADIINEKINDLGFNARAESTGGSVFNLNAIIVADLEFGLVQSDRQYQAWNGLKDWKDRGPQKNLRSICSFYSESVVLVAGNDTGIKSIYDLKGKRVNIGNFGSGPRGNAVDALESCGLDWRRELNVLSIRASDSLKLLENRRIDAFFYTISHPNALINKATKGKRKVHFVLLGDECIDNLVTKWPYYAKAYIPVKLYPLAANNSDIETFGVKATFCTSKSISKDIVYKVTKEIFNNLEYLKRLYPGYDVLNKKNMLKALSAPIHEGALKFYKETGLIK